MSLSDIPGGIGRFARWKPLIDQSRTEAQLLRAMREYCSAWLPSELLLLPEDCQDCSPATTDDLIHLAVAFKRADLRMDGSDEARLLMGEMSRTFVYAVERLRMFHHPAAAPPPD